MNEQGTEADARKQSEIERYRTVSFRTKFMMENLHIQEQILQKKLEDYYINQSSLKLTEVMENGRKQ